MEINSVKDDIAEMNAIINCWEVEHWSFFFAVIIKVQILVEHSVVEQIIVLLD